MAGKQARCDSALAKAREKLRLLEAEEVASDLTRTTCKQKAEEEATNALSAAQHRARELLREKADRQRAAESRPAAAWEPPPPQRVSYVVNCDESMLRCGMRVAPGVEHRFMNRQQTLNGQTEKKQPRPRTAEVVRSAPIYSACNTPGAASDYLSPLPSCKVPRRALRPPRACWGFDPIDPPQTGVPCRHRPISASTRNVAPPAKVRLHTSPPRSTARETLAAVRNQLIFLQGASLNELRRSDTEEKMAHVSRTLCGAPLDVREALLKDEAAQVLSQLQDVRGLLEKELQDQQTSLKMANLTLLSPTIQKEIAAFVEMTEKTQRELDDAQRIVRLRDRCARVLQKSFRVMAAKCRLRQRQQDAKRLALDIATHEAAVMIQRNFRRHLTRRIGQPPTLPTLPSGAPPLT